VPLVSISEAQREPIPTANFVGTVLHGIPRELFEPTLLPRGGYLAFLGRISPEKRVDRAIAIARAVGLPLKIAAKVDRTDEAYFKQEIAPLLDQPGIEFIGEVDEEQKGRFLGEARALLFPIDWPEPFGLVLIEAMACGTPVLAFRHGSVAEVVEDGITGHIVDGVDEAIRNIGRVLALDRGRVRRRFEQRFTSQRIVQDYVKIYEQLVGRGFHIGADRARPNIVANGSPQITADRTTCRRHGWMARSTRPRHARRDLLRRQVRKPIYRKRSQARPTNRISRGRSTERERDGARLVCTTRRRSKGINAHRKLNGLQTEVNAWSRETEV
jgi:Glycosyl transferases group 1